MFEKIKRFYNLKLYTQEQVYNFVRKGIISQDQYEEIISSK